MMMEELGDITNFSQDCLSQSTISAFSTVGDDSFSKDTWVTKHFSTHNVNGEPRRFCLFQECHKSFSVKSSHRCLRKHWLLHDNDEKFDDATMPIEFKFHSEPHIDAFIKFILDYRSSYSICDNERFKTFCRSMAPHKTMIDRHLVSDIIIDSVDEIRLMITAKLSSAESVSLTFDIWTARKSDASYGCIKCHFIDNLFRLQSYVLEFEHMPYPHDGGAISAFIERCLERYCIVGKVIAITTDSASNNILGVSLLIEKLSLNENHIVKFLHMKCIAHIINLCVKEALKKVDLLIDPVRKVVEAVRSSTKGGEHFERIQSEIYGTNIERMKIDTPLKLLSELETRWNSTYTMLERAFRLKDSIARALAEIRELQHIPELEILIDFFKTFSQLTETFSREYYAAVSLMKVALPKIRNHCSKNYAVGAIAKAAISLGEKLDNYEICFEDDAVKLATYLDPRVKISLVPAKEQEAIKQYIRSFLDQD